MILKASKGIPILFVKACLKENIGKYWDKAF